MSVADALSDVGGVEAGRLAELYRVHIVPARRIAILLTGSAEAGEDLAHDAFLRAAGRFADLRAPEMFRTYLLRAVVNAARSEHRKRSRERRHVERLETGEATKAVAPHDPAERDSMWRALHALPERQRAALVLRYYEDLTEAAIADALRCRPGTVKSLISRGLDALRKEVDP